MGVKSAMKCLECKILKITMEILESPLKLLENHNEKSKIII